MEGVNACNVNDISLSPFVLEMKVNETQPSTQHTKMTSVTLHITILSTQPRPNVLSTFSSIMSCIVSLSKRKEGECRVKKAEKR